MRVEPEGDRKSWPYPGTCRDLWVNHTLPPTVGCSKEGGPDDQDEGEEGVGSG